MKKVSMILATVLMALVGSAVVDASTRQENFVVVVDDYRGGVLITFDIRQEVCSEDDADCEELLDKIIHIRGVDNVYADESYSLTVVRGKAFSSQEIQKEVLWVLKEHFNGKNMISVNYVDKFDPQELAERELKSR